jgi:hypothetical protein
VSFDAIQPQDSGEWHFGLVRLLPLGAASGGVSAACVGEQSVLNVGRPLGTQGVAMLDSPVRRALREIGSPMPDCLALKEDCNDV